MQTMTTAWRTTKAWHFWNNHRSGNACIPMRNGAMLTPDAYNAIAEILGNGNRAEGWDIMEELYERE